MANIVAVSPSVRVAAKLFWGLADPTRLSILLALQRGERRVTDLVDDVGGSQANVSDHLACLKDCGLVVHRSQGRQNFYRLAHPELRAVLEAAEALLVGVGEQVELCANYRQSAQ
jgi:DNA-binding transcriptional ArsR family regulator